MDGIELKTFQPSSRVDTLTEDGELRGSWDHIGSVSWEPAYRGMVAEMERLGIPCHGHPPIWAWWGPLTLSDATSLLNEEHDLSRSYATITFTAPRSLVLLSDYGDWCDALFPYRPWKACPVFPSAEDLLQATVPYLLQEWVSSLVPLPTSGFEELDLGQRL